MGGFIRCVEVRRRCSACYADRHSFILQPMYRHALERDRHDAASEGWWWLWSSCAINPGLMRPCSPYHGLHAQDSQPVIMTCNVA